MSGATIFNQNYKDWDRYEAKERKPGPRRATRSDRESFTEEINIARIADATGFDAVKYGLNADVDRQEAHAPLRQRGDASGEGAERDANSGLTASAGLTKRRAVASVADCRPLLMTPEYVLDVLINVKHG